MTASAAAAVGHNTRSDRQTPMLLAIWFFMDVPLRRVRTGVRDVFI
jgi:hypothetical protein